jgi:hypothetical protein
VRRAPPGGHILIGLPLTGQPFRCKEPRLIGGDGHIAADGDRPVIVDRELHVVAFAQAKVPRMHSDLRLRSRAKMQR